MNIKSDAGPVIFTGKAHPGLAERICSYLGRPLGKMDTFKFSNDNSFVRILENVRQRDVFVVQPTAFPVNDNIMEMLIMIDALKRASAGRITAVIPHYSYARTDKKDQPRVPITARLIADLIDTAGAERAVLVDLHAGQVQGFFSCPVDELTTMPIIVDYFKTKKLDDMVVVATDIGISKKARDFASRLDAPLAIVEKRRIGNGDSVESLNVIGNVDGKRAVLFDDEINAGTTMIAAADALLARGVTEMFVCAAHAVFSGNASHRIAALERMTEIVVTDTLPITVEKENPKLKVLPTAHLLGEAIIRIHEGRSVGAIFK